MLPADGGELVGVAQDAEEDLLKPGRIAAHVMLRRGQVEAHLNAVLGAAVSVGVPEDLVDVDVLKLHEHFLVQHAREVQQIIDQACFHLDVAANDLDVGAAALGELAIALQQRDGEQCRRQRGAQLVRQGGEEIVLGLAGALGLGAGGALAGEQAFALLLGLLAIGNVVDQSGEHLSPTDRHFAHRQVHRKRRAILAQANDLAAGADDFLNARLQIALKVLLVFSLKRRRHEHVDVAANQL